MKPLPFKERYFSGYTLQPASHWRQAAPARFSPVVPRSQQELGPQRSSSARHLDSAPKPVLYGSFGLIPHGSPTLFLRQPSTMTFTTQITPPHTRLGPHRGIRDVQNRGASGNTSESPPCPAPSRQGWGPSAFFPLVLQGTLEGIPCFFN